MHREVVCVAVVSVCPMVDVSSHSFSSKLAAGWRSQPSEKSRLKKSLLVHRTTSGRDRFCSMRVLSPHLSHVLSVLTVPPLCESAGHKLTAEAYLELLLPSSLHRRGHCVLRWQNDIPQGVGAVNRTWVPLKASDELSLVQKSGLSDIFLAV